MPCILRSHATREKKKKKKGKRGEECTHMYALEVYTHVHAKTKGSKAER
jgi:hypothetical protein